jgi:hypothetical protein
MSGISVSALVEGGGVRRLFVGRLPEGSGDVLARHARNRSPFCAALFACDDSNSRYGHLQTFGPQSPQRLVRMIVDGPGRNPLGKCEPASARL